MADDYKDDVIVDDTDDNDPDKTVTSEPIPLASEGPFVSNIKLGDGDDAPTYTIKDADARDDISELKSELAESTVPVSYAFTDTSGYLAAGVIYKFGRLCVFYVQIYPFAGSNGDVIATIPSECTPNRTWYYPFAQMTTSVTTWTGGISVNASGNLIANRNSTNSNENLCASGVWVTAS